MTYKSCIKCGNEIKEISQEDLEIYGYFENEELCDSCIEDQEELENTCPIHKTYNQDGFCEACLLMDK